MHLKLQTDYALRTLIYLAHRRELIAVEEIASALEMSRDHLFKIVQQLVRLGYIASKPGRSGGVRLCREPEQIRVDQVVGEFEGRNGVLACVQDPGACVLEPGCVLRVQLIKAERAFYDTLAEMTIADVLLPNAVRQSGGVYNLTVHRAPAARASAASAAPVRGSAQADVGALPTAQAAEGLTD